MLTRLRQRRQKRWGVRTLAFLGLAGASILGSNLQGRYTLITFTGLLVGLIGAAVSSFRGLTNR